MFNAMEEPEFRCKYCSRKFPNHFNDVLGHKFEADLYRPTEKEQGWQLRRLADLIEEEMPGTFNGYRQGSIKIARRLLKDAPEILNDIQFPDELMKLSDSATPGKFILGGDVADVNTDMTICEDDECYGSIAITDMDRINEAHTGSEYFKHNAAFIAAACNYVRERFRK
jgi:hypothetical protein